MLPVDDPIPQNREECGALAATLSISRWRSVFQDDFVGHGCVVAEPYIGK